jgi:glutamate-ammonia-ligase adenylyltransferase
METLAAAFLARLEQGRPDREALRTLGESDPEAAAAAFLHATREPELAATQSVWVPALLRAARPGFGAQCLTELAQKRRAADRAPLDLRQTPALPLVLGSSNFLARLLLRRPEWADELRGQQPQPPDPARVEGGWAEIRLAKYRGLLRIAARDLLGYAVDESLRELSDLADRCLAAALECAALETDTEAPALLALGKLGGRELNFSSDVDLLFVYHAEPHEDDLERNRAVGRLIQRFKGQLDAPSADGFGYRVDLDLRPEGRTGVLANSIAAALGYYESFGAEWERQMLIRLRPLAGPGHVAEAFTRGITPFVYRSLIDPSVMRNVREMKTRIETERRQAGRDLEVNLKEGPGGIRDVEFLVQSFQLFYGARFSELRTGNVFDALATLGGLGLLPEAVTSALADAYRWLRRTEHALQLAEEQQTSEFPREPASQLALARRLGYADAEGKLARERLLDDWTAVRSEVRGHFEALVLRGEA